MAIAPGMYAGELPLTPGRILVTSTPSVDIAVKIAAFVLDNPGVEVLIAAQTLEEIDDLSDLMLNKLVGRVLVGKSALGRRPFSLRLPNGSRVIGRISRRDGAGLRGIHPHLIWWCGRWMPDYVKTELVGLVRWA